MTVTRSACPTCDNPSDATRFLADFLRGNRNPSLNHLLAAARHDSEVAQDRADQAARIVAAAVARFEAAQTAAVAARTRADAETADAANAGNLPLLVADQVRASADLATAAADAAEALVKDIAAELVALRSEAADINAAAERIAADTFTPADLAAAYDELGVVEDGGNQLYPVTSPTPDQARTRRLVNFI